jgi:hypothetical protein
VLRPGRLRALLDRHGGFTVEPRSGAAMRHGVSVCTEPHLSLRLPGWDTPTVTDWLAARADAYLRPGCYVGGWADPAADDVWLDVVRLLPVTWLHAALQAADRHGQRGVFDLCRSELVRVRAS